MQPLDPSDHDRAGAGLTYVYPVVSRRARGLSVGVNLSPNNACNWRCIYCQVPHLVRGGAPEPDLEVLARELRTLLTEVVHGEFLVRHVPEPLRRLNDVAFSGNGEPTASPRFADAVGRVGRILEELGLVGRIKLILITNGSRVQQPPVMAGLRAMAPLGGELWFKVDRGTTADIRAVNDVHLHPAQILHRLDTAAHLCPTWVQTCMFAVDGRPPEAGARSAYLGLLRQALERGIPLRGVYLYGIARPSFQPEAPRLSRLPDTWLEELAGEIEALGLAVEVAP